MGGQIDQRLLDHLDQLQDDDIGNAVVVFKVEQAPSTNSEVTAQAMLDDATKAIGAAPTEVRVMPLLGAMYVAGPKLLLKQVLSDERVTAASIGTEDLPKD